jgi:hypothetical protein
MMRRAICLLVVTVIGGLGVAGCGMSSPRSEAARGSLRLVRDMVRGPGSRVDRAVGGVWKRAATLVAAGQDTSAPQLALFGSDAMVAGWLQGPFPQVTFLGDQPAQAAPAAVQSVVVDLGTLAGGFGARRCWPVGRAVARERDRVWRRPDAQPWYRASSRRTGRSSG